MAPPPIAKRATNTVIAVRAMFTYTVRKKKKNLIFPIGIRLIFHLPILLLLPPLLFVGSEG